MTGLPLRVAALALLLLPAPAVGGALRPPAVPPVAAATPAVLDALDNVLTLTPAPDVPPACELVATDPRTGAATALGCDPDSSAGAADSEQADFGFEPRHVIETPQSWAAYTPFDGPADGAVLRVHGWGDVAAMDADGHTLWTRGSMTFSDDWGVPLSIVPFVHLGAAPSNPFLRVTERTHAVGDVTGDGVDDVVVSHRLSRSGQPDLFAVTILDGTDGTTLWTRMHDGFTSQVHLDGTRLLVAEEGVGGGTSRLHALDLAFDGAHLRADEAWTFDSGAAGARWLALEPFGDDRVALALTNKPVGAAGQAGRVVAVRTAGDGEGTADWDVVTEGYPRVLRADPTRDALVVHLQTDPQQAWAYALAALDADGNETARLTRQGAMLVSLAVGDVTGDGSAEWIAGDAEVDSGGLIAAGRVIATDPGGDLWVRRTDGSSPGGLLLTYGLAPLDGAVAAGSRTFRSVESPSNPFAFAAGDLEEHGPDLRLLDGRDGGVRWSEPDALFPLYLEPFTVDGEAALLGGTAHLAVRGYAVADGGRLLDAPLLADPHSVTVAEHPDGARHLVVGTGSGGVFSLPADGLADVPEVAWRTSLPGRVRTVEVADVTGDGSPEVVVAATNAVAVLDALDGTVRTLIPVTDGFVWSVTAADLTGDGVAELVVPTRTLAAYRLDGTLLWRYAPLGQLEAADVQTYFSNAVVSGGRVAAQAGFDPPTTFAGTRTVQLFVALEAGTGAVAWLDQNSFPASIPRFWHSTVLLPGAGRDGGDAVGFVYSHTVFSPGASWRHAGLAYDVASGSRLSHQGPSTYGNAAHVGALERHGDLYQADVATLTRHRPDGQDQVGFAVSVTSLGWRDLGPFGEKLVFSGLQSVGVYPPDIPWGDPDDHLDEPLRWTSQLLLGGFAVVHLDDGAAPQVVAHRADYDAYATVARFEGVGASLSSLQPEALVVLDLVAP